MKDYMEMRVDEVIMQNSVQTREGTKLKRINISFDLHNLHLHNTILHTLMSGMGWLPEVHQ